MKKNAFGGWRSKAAKATIFILLIFFILTVIADFSARQSFALFILMMAAMTYANHRIFTEAERSKNVAASKPNWKFIPYRVRIDPKWQEILTDFKLISASNDWEEIKRSIWEAVPYGISYTMLQQSDDLQTQVIFRAQHHGIFFSEIEFCEEVAPIQFEDVPMNLRLFMKWGGDSYALGIIVPEQWWERVKMTSTQSIEERGGEMWPETELVLATIPYAEFDWYRQPDLPYDERERKMEQITANRDAQRIKFGWVEAEHYEGGPKYLRHKYFELSHSSI
jgi:hypothetical protein